MGRGADRQHAYTGFIYLGDQTKNLAFPCCSLFQAKQIQIPQYHCSSLLFSGPSLGLFAPLLCYGGHNEHSVPNTT